MRKPTNDPPLSPAAQAVLDAFWKQPGDRSALAAVLRAVVNQVVPESPPEMHICCHELMENIRSEILAIATELEGSDG